MAAVAATAIGLKLRPHLEKLGWLKTFNPVEAAVRLNVLKPWNLNEHSDSLNADYSREKRLFAVTDHGIALIGFLESVDEAAGLNDPPAPSSLPADE